MGLTPCTARVHDGATGKERPRRAATAAGPWRESVERRRFLSTRASLSVRLIPCGTRTWTRGGRSGRGVSAGGDTRWGQQQQRLFAVNATVRAAHRAPQSTLDGVATVCVFLAV